MKEHPSVPLQELADGIFDGPHATPPESMEGPIFLRLDNITSDGRLDLSDLRFIAPQDFPRWTRRVTPQAGDVVFSYEATLHRYVVIPEGFHGCLGRRLALIRPNRQRVQPEYLHYYFLTDRWRRTAASAVINGATVDRISLLRVRDLPLLIPPLTVQQRVVDILSAYDDLIENNRRRMALLEESARQLYQEWFVRLRFPGHEHTRIVDRVPEGWSQTDLKTACIPDNGIQTGPFGSQLHQADYSEEGIPVVMPKDIVGSLITTVSIARVPEEIQQRLARHAMQPGDIVLARRGDIGRKALVTQREEGWMCGTGCMRLRPNPEIAFARVLFDTLGRADVMGIIAARAQGAIMPNLNLRGHLIITSNFCVSSGKPSHGA